MHDKQRRWFTEEHVRENGVPVTRIIQRGKLSESVEKFKKEDEEHHEAQEEHEETHHRSRATQKRQDRRHKHIGFKKLENKVEREAGRKHPSWSASRKKRYAAGAAAKVKAEIAAKHGRR